MYDVCMRHVLGRIFIFRAEFPLCQRSTRALSKRGRRKPMQDAQYSSEEHPHTSDLAYGRTRTGKNTKHYIQLDRVVFSLEALVRSSAPHVPPTTLRAFFDSPG